MLSTRSTAPALLVPQPAALFYLRRLFVSAMLRSPGGFGAGSGSCRGAGGASLSGIALKLRTLGDSGKRSRAIVSRSSSPMIALSPSVRSGVMP